MFVGRQEELRRLEDAYDTGTFQMAVVYGRRRVGKTTLILEFARNKRALFFTALEQADADNLADFTRAMLSSSGCPGACASTAGVTPSTTCVSARCRNASSS